MSSFFDDEHIHYAVRLHPSYGEREVADRETLGGAMAAAWWAWRDAGPEMRSAGIWECRTRRGTTVSRMIVTMKIDGNKAVFEDVSWEKK